MPKTDQIVRDYLGRKVDKPVFQSELQQAAEQSMTEAASAIEKLIMQMDGKTPFSAADLTGMAATWARDGENTTTVMRRLAELYGADCEDIE